LTTPELAAAVKEFPTNVLVQELALQEARKAGRSGKELTPYIARVITAEYAELTGLRGPRDSYKLKQLFAALASASYFGRVAASPSGYRRVLCLQGEARRHCLPGDLPVSQLQQRKARDPKEEHFIRMHGIWRRRCGCSRIFSLTASAARRNGIAAGAEICYVDVLLFIDFRPQFRRGYEAFVRCLRQHCDDDPWRGARGGPRLADAPGPHRQHLCGGRHGGRSRPHRGGSSDKRVRPAILRRDARRRRRGDRRPVRRQFAARRIQF